MPPKPKPNTPAQPLSDADIDALLDFGTPAPEEPVNKPERTVAVETIEVPEPTAAPEEKPVVIGSVVVNNPAPVEVDVAALQAQIAELQAALVTKAINEAEAKALPENEVKSEEGEVITIHILSDGLTAAGRVWYRGQTLRFPVGGTQYKQTLDKDGKSWLDLATDQRAQVKKFGAVKFGAGPWPFDEAEESQVREAERRRNGSVPVFSA